jgi:hypothetical protein
MAEPAGRRVDLREDPPLADPRAIEQAYRRERAKRRAKVEHRRRAKHAGLRFWVVLWILLFACVILGLTIWSQVQQLFGL